jgi:DnaK suppressor protein
MFQEPSSGFGHGAHPDSGLTPEQTERLHRKLLEIREALIEGYERHRDSGRFESAEQESEEQEAAQRASERATMLDLAEAERRQLQEIDRALRKLDQGVYGVSETSGEPIGFERLDAIPWARLSASDQEELEREARARRGY